MSPQTLDPLLPSFDSPSLLGSVCDATQLPVMGVYHMFKGVF